MEKNSKKCPVCGKLFGECPLQQNRSGLSFSKIMKENEKTPDDFARILSVELGEVQDMLHGKKRPKSEQMILLATSLGISPFDFINRALDMSPIFMKAS
ncbi:MAG: helix-turn-helix transcriptional regulator [Candidatus Paceibacterota bacterium]